MLSPEEHTAVVQDLIEQLYQYIHAYIKYTKRMKCADNSNMFNTTSFVNSFTFSLLEKQETKVVEPFLKAKAFSQYLKYLQQGISWFVSNKIVKGNRDFPFVQAPTDEETGEEFSFPDDYQPDPVMQDMLDQLSGILNEKLNEGQKQLLEMRLGVKFVKNGDSIRLISYQEPMTFPQIAKALGGGQTEESVGKRFTRLIDKIKETPAVILLYRDFAE